MVGSGFTDSVLEALAATLESEHVIVHAPTLFAERVRPAPPPAEAASLQSWIQHLLWPMTRDDPQPRLLNRVRLKRDGPVLPYRIVTCPLLIDGQPIGFIAALRPQSGAPFLAEDIETLSAALQKLHHRLAMRIEAGSGLLTRQEFEREVALRAQANDSACVVYANLDQVHVINEISGFAAGDAVIADVSRLWRLKLLPAGSIATHLSGDRYAAVLFKHTPNQASTWAEGVRSAIEHRSLDADQNRVTASFGVAALHDADSLQHALAAAETACRVAKERGRNRVELYDAGDQTMIRRHEAVRESRLFLDALEDDRLELHAQRIVALSPRLNSQHYEILLRVRELDGRFQSIASYLDAAERYQLLERLDRWVIERTVRVLGPHAAALSGFGAGFSVNITGQSLSQPVFADFVRARIKSNNLPAGLLDFELTETAAVRNINATRRFIARMAEIGSRVALDDFGTGLSSLVHLKDLDVYRIKIDGKFVSDVVDNARSRSLIRALVQIAGELRLETVAEFVENAEIAASIQALGVDYAQGYLYGRSAPLGDVLAELLQSAGAAAATAVGIA